MGYTHHWKLSRPLTTPERDTLRVFAEIVISKHQQILAGPDGLGSPEIGHAGIALNGTHNVRYETFAFSFDRSSNFCKTQQRPYDKVVVALLCLAAHVAPDACSVSSDGDARDWAEGLQIARTTLPACADVQLPDGVS